MSTNISVPCEAGTYRSNNYTYCLPCPVNKYTDVEGSASCKYCAEGEVSNADKTSCSKLL